MREKRYRLIRLETLADPDEFEDLNEKLQSIRQAHVKAELYYPGGRRVQYLMPPPHEVFIAVVTTLSGLATLADVLIRYLRRPVRRGPRSATLRFDGREMIIRGGWSKEELETILRRFSRPLSQQAQVKEISLIERAKKKELRRELKQLQEVLPTYTDLVEIGRKSGRKYPGWKGKLKDYEARKRAIESRITALRKLLRAYE